MDKLNYVTSKQADTTAYLLVGLASPLELGTH